MAALNPIILVENRISGGPGPVNRVKAICRKNYGIASEDDYAWEQELWGAR
jgi:hypothetical protein